MELLIFHMKAPIYQLSYLVVELAYSQHLIYPPNYEHDISHESCRFEARIVRNNELLDF